MLHTNADIMLCDRLLLHLMYTQTKNSAALLKQHQDKTIVFVTHKISMVDQFDRIMVMHQGEIVADGNHHDLLLSNPYYQQLFIDYKDEQRTLPYIKSFFEQAILQQYGRLTWLKWFLPLSWVCQAGSAPHESTSSFCACACLGRW